MNRSIINMALRIVEFSRNVGLLTKVLFVSALYWTMGSLFTLIMLFVPAAAFDLSNRSPLAWGLVLLPPIGGLLMIFWKWEEIKAAASAFSLLPDEEAVETAKGLAGLVVVVPISIAGLLLLCLVLWGGYTLLASLPISVAIVVGAILIALAILLVASASE